MGETTAHDRKVEELTDRFFGNRPGIMHMYGEPADGEQTCVELALRLLGPVEVLSDLDDAAVGAVACGRFPIMIVVLDIVASRDLSPEQVGARSAHTLVERYALISVDEAQMRWLLEGLRLRLCRRHGGPTSARRVRDVEDEEYLWPIRAGERLVEVRFGLAPIPGIRAVA